MKRNKYSILVSYELPICFLSFRCHDCDKYHKKAVPHSIRGQVPLVSVYYTYLEGIQKRRGGTYFKICSEWGSNTNSSELLVRKTSIPLEKYLVLWSILEKCIIMKWFQHSCIDLLICNFTTVHYCQHFSFLQTPEVPTIPRAQDIMGAGDNTTLNQLYNKKRCR